MKKPVTMLQWVCYTAAGWLLGVVLVLVVSFVFDALAIGGQLPVAIGMGLSVAAAQWLMLRKQLAIGFTWVWVSVACFCVAFFTGDAATFLLRVPTETVLPFTTVLAVTSTSWFQYRYMLNNKPGSTKSWMAYSITGWLLPVVTVLTLSTYFHENHVRDAVMHMANLFTLLVAGPLLGYLTGRSIMPVLQKNNRPG